MFTDEDRARSVMQKQLAALPRVFSKGSGASNHQLLNYLFLYKGRERKCEECGAVEWRGQKLKHELHHIDGDSANNEESNLQILCPNCHSLTGNYCGKNVNNGLIKVSDEGILSAFIEEGNVRKALLKLGLAAKGGNYERVYKVLDANGITVTRYRNMGPSNPEGAKWVQ